METDANGAVENTRITLGLSPRRQQPRMFYRDHDWLGHPRRNLGPVSSLDKLVEVPRALAVHISCNRQRLIEFWPMPHASYISKPVLSRDTADSRLFRCLMTKQTTILVPLRYPLTADTTRTLAVARRLATDHAPAALTVLH